MPKSMRALAACTIAMSSVGCQSPTADEGPRYEPDHLFVMCAVGAPEMAAFEEAGFVLWPDPVSHTGQGTTGRYIYFDNFYIEFLWIDDAEAATGNIEHAATDFNARSDWQVRGDASPFGLGLRDLHPERPVASGWHKYKSGWMGSNPESFISVWTSSDRLDLPWVFSMPPFWTRRPRENMQGEKLLRLDHPNGARVLTSAVISYTGDAPLEPRLANMQNDAIFRLAPGETPLAVLTFDDHAQGGTLDFRPDTPLVIHY